MNDLLLQITCLCKLRIILPSSFSSICHTDHSGSSYGGQNSTRTKDNLRYFSWWMTWYGLGHTKNWNWTWNILITSARLSDVPTSNTS